MTAKAKFGQVEDAYCTWTALKGVVEIAGYTDIAGILQLHVSFLLADDKAEELAKMILERVQARRESRKGSRPRVKRLRVGAPPVCGKCFRLHHVGTRCRFSIGKRIAK